MRVRQEDIEPNDFESPKGRFGVAGREHVSCEDTGCPFDLEHVILKPGKKNFPFHTHGSLWELYYAVSGTATMRTDEETAKSRLETVTCAGQGSPTRSAMIPMRTSSTW